VILVLTWLHQVDHETLKVHPRGEVQNPLSGVFATRSPDRPNPIGLHRVTLLEIFGRRLRVHPIEAVEGTPVLDIKPVLTDEP
jgi:tRNA-Thr(GGU) m(6)t(6)A37 methyltransferase TsaA